MAMSWMVLFDPGLTLRTNDEQPGVFVKNYIDQSQEFALCAVALAYPIMTLLCRTAGQLAAVLAAVALGLLANMMFVTVSRTALVTMPIMLARIRSAASEAANLDHRLLRGRGCWRRRPGAPRRNCARKSRCSSPTVSTIGPEQSDRSGFTAGILAEVAAVFRRGPGHRTWHRIDPRPVRTGRRSARSARTPKSSANPHNQTLNVAVQWGAIGVVVLYAMWLRPSAAVSRRRPDGVDRTDGRGAEYLHVAVQLASVRFPRRLDVCARRRRRRRHDARRGRATGSGSGAAT